MTTENIISPCVVENGLNTCYLDSLFVGMFYKPSIMDSILEKDPKDTSAIFLQELIKMKFVEPLRRHYSINESVMNEIRNYAVVCGWCKGDDYVDEQQDVSEFYIFLINALSVQYIEFEKIAVDEDLKENSSMKEKLPYIPLYPVPDSTSLIGHVSENNEKHEVQSVKDLLTNWINSNIVELNNKTFRHYYKLTNIPSFIPLHINRFEPNGTRIKSKIDIMRRIKFFGINDNTQKNLRWKIHSIICHKGDTMKSGHYYTIVLTGDKRWLLFDDKNIPSIRQIDINDYDTRESIMLDCMFLFYVLE